MTIIEGYIGEEERETEMLTGAIVGEMSVDGSWYRSNRYEICLPASDNYSRRRLCAEFVFISIQSADNGAAPLDCTGMDTGSKGGENSCNGSDVHVCG
jgi:hypothetical protein